MDFNSAAAGLVFDVQRFSTHDGPGIRTAVFFKGCPLRCAWCQNPESIKPWPELGFYEGRCAACMKCVEACPERRAGMSPGRITDRAKCRICGRCAEACNHDARRLIGKWRTAEELFEIVEKDRAFYEESGGGVTLSGGEPALQHKFVEGFATLCGNAGLKVAMETSGYFNPKKISGLLARLDLILFDLKIIDDDFHKKHTGVSNKTILRNLSSLVAEGVSILPRMPLVPGFTFTRDNMLEVARFLEGISLKSVELLPYHSMGESKLEPLQSAQPRLKLAPLEKAQLDDAQRIFLSRGINAGIPA